MDKISFKGAFLNRYNAPNTTLADREKLAKNLMRHMSELVGGDVVKDDSFSYANGQVKAEAFDIIKTPMWAILGKAKSVIKVFVIQDDKNSVVEMITVARDFFNKAPRIAHQEAKTCSFPLSLHQSDQVLALEKEHNNIKIKNDEAFDAEVKRSADKTKVIAETMAY